MLRHILFPSLVAFAALLATACSNERKPDVPSMEEATDTITDPLNAKLDTAGVLELSGAFQTPKPNRVKGDTMQSYWVHLDAMLTMSASDYNKMDDVISFDGRLQGPITYSVHREKASEPLCTRTIRFGSSYEATGAPGSVMLTAEMEQDGMPYTVSLTGGILQGDALAFQTFKFLFNEDKTCPASVETQLPPFVLEVDQEGEAGSEPAS